MAPTLTSNSSFLLQTTPHPTRLNPRTPRRLTVSAKKAGPTFPPFRLGKSADAADSGSEEKPGSKPFFLDFGKFSDVKSLVPALTKQSAPGGFSRRKDEGTVFVAGATGQAGIRIAQTLLRQGFSVRAGVPDLGAAQELARLAAKYKIISIEESKRLNAVESTFENEESIAKAIGNASKVVVTIGPTENGATTEVNTSDALQVIKAAQLAGVGHVAIIYDGSVLASTYNVLDGIQTFFNNLFARSQSLTIEDFLEKVVETDVRYTLIKTQLTEDFAPESSYNVVVSVEGSVRSTDYKVATSQIASLVANVFSNTSVAENKVVEVSTAPSAPSKNVDELFSAIPEDGRRKAYAEATAKAKAEEEAQQAEEKARGAANAAKKLEKQKQSRAAAAAAASQSKEDEPLENGAAAAAGASMEELMQKAKGFSAGLSWDKLSSQLAAATADRSSDENPKTQVATVRGQAKARSLPAKKAVVKPAMLKFPSFNAKKLAQPDQPKPKQNGRQTKQTEPKPEVRKVFGGLFQQETIYVDD